MNWFYVVVFITLQITEDDFARVVIEFAEGEFETPSFFAGEELTEEQLIDFQNANIFRKVIK